MSSSYPSHLTQDQWELLASLLPDAKPGGRPRSVDLQAVMNALFYILCAGCAWRMLPSDFPKWKTVYDYFRAWRSNGTWKRVNHQLHQWVRVSENRDSSTSAAILDSQSVKTATPAAIEVGYDAAKQVKGRSSASARRYVRLGADGRGYCCQCPGTGGCKTRSGAT